MLEVYPNKDKTGGHAITLIKGNSNIDDNIDFYIIDDQNSISKLSDYYNNRKERLYEISIRDVDEITIANVNAIFHAKCDIDPSCKFSKRVSRFVLNFEHNFLKVEDDMLKPELKTENSMNETIQVKYKDKKETILLMFLFGLVVGIIVGILVRNVMNDYVKPPITNSVD